MGARPSGGGEVRCSGCGEAVDDSVRFCPSCGTPVSGAAAVAWRRAAVRAHRRRVRRALGVLAFIVVAIVILAIAVMAVTGDGSSSGHANDVTPRAVTTVAAPRPDHPAGPYKVTDGVNVRAGPGTNYARVGTIEMGKDVLVNCVIEGQVVSSPNGSTSQWLQVTSGTMRGYVASQYVAIGAAITDRSVVPVCEGV
jgi:uncharacterized protein YgiM (DUF1202 family)